MAFSGVLLRLLALAVEVQVARQNRSAGSDPGSPAIGPIAPPLPQEAAFRDYCRSLTPAQLYMATMVMYAGRGDFGSSFDIMDRYQQMSDTFHSPGWAVRQMLEKFPLPEYYAVGVRTLAEMGCDIDRLC